MGKVLLKSLQIYLSKFTGGGGGGGGKLQVESSKEEADAAPWMFSCKYPKTLSFSLERGTAKSGEDIFKNYNSLYIVSDSKTESSRVLVSLPEDEEEKGHLDAFYESKRFVITYEGDKACSGKACFIEEEALDLEDYSSKFSSDSSVFSSDSSSGSSDLPPGLVRGLSSKRFFFNPGRSNSILDEAKCFQPEGFSVDSQNSSFFSLRREKIDLPFCTDENCSSDSGSGESDQSRNDEDDGDGDGEASDGDSHCESLAESSDIHDKFQCESIAVLKYSPNPYWDFRISMQEMVDAHNLTDWHCLQEMLLCYLRLNKKKTHKLILGAFADLVINLIAKTSPPLLDYDTTDL
jgi:uncharacterized protein (TIGR01568 family)